MARIRRTPRRKFTAAEVLRRLRSLGSAKARAAQAHFAITPRKSYGVSAPRLHALAREIGTDQTLSLKLWRTGVHEARILAAMTGDPRHVTPLQMERWAREFDTWDVVDCTCCYLFAYAAPAWQKAVAWSRRREEFVKRAGFSLMAYLAYKDKTAPDAKFLRLLPIIRREATDPRNFVRKAVNWALRQIGKRNTALNRAAIREALEIRRLDSPVARWIAADALRELQSPAIQRRLRSARPVRL